MNKDFERCCSFLADMIIKYAPEIKEEVTVLNLHHIGRMQAIGLLRI